MALLESSPKLFVCFQALENLLWQDKFDVV